MAIIKILQYPDPRLKTVGEHVTDFGDTLQRVVDDMFETHYAQANCAALAATQLDFKKPKHITVIDFSEKKNQPLCLVNAEITERHGEYTSAEGCMSVPCGIYEPVTRAEKIHVKAQDRHGNALDFEADGFLAKCIQHELDHLAGKVFLAYLSAFKRKRIDSKIRKYWHEEAKNAG